jgi:hypothetical protein
MIAAITAILGFLSAMGPGILQLFTVKETHAQQLALRKLDLEAARQGAAIQVDLASAQADIRQADHIYGFASGASGYRFVDALAVLVRPYITMVMFHLWVGIEASLLIYGINHGYDIGQLYKLIWDEPTQAIFAAIMGFWFGNRMLNRSQQSMAATMAVTAPNAVVVKAGPSGLSGVIPKPPGSRD